MRWLLNKVSDVQRKLSNSDEGPNLLTRRRRTPLLWTMKGSILGLSLTNPSMT